MVDPQLVTVKLAELQQRIDRVHALAPLDAAVMRDDRDVQDLVAFNFMLCLQSCTDIVSHIISDEGWTPASSASAGFFVLLEHDILLATTAEQLAKGVGLRNMIAHGYAKVDAERLHTAATQGLRFVEAFASEIAAWMLGSDH